MPSMADSSSKIITTFQNRLEMEAALRSLGQADNDRALRQRAAEIVAQHGQKILPLLLAALDTPSPQVRAGLGFIAQQLERESAVAALRAAAHNRSLSDQARLAAIVILERFLEEDAEDAMYAGMAAPHELALQSLREMLAETHTDVAVLAEYFRQLDEEPDDVHLAMLRATRTLEGTEGVPVLSMFAQDANHLVAQEALQALGTIADSAAGLALQGLLPNLPPDLRQQAERSLQKLRLRGVAVPGLQAAPATARCLASPITAEGFQVLWFWLPQTDGTALDMHLLVNIQTGIVAAGQTAAVYETAIPAAQPHGALLRGALDQPLLQETSIDYGRRRLLALMPQHWHAGRSTPPLYRLLSPQLWQWTSPAAAAPLPAETVARREDTPQVLHHPAMAAWVMQSQPIYARAEEILTGAEAPTSESFAHLVQETLRAQLNSGDLSAEALQAHLLAMAEWFMLAGEVHLSGLALAGARTLTEEPEQHPLLLAMCDLGLRLASVALARGLIR